MASLSIRNSVDSIVAGERTVVQNVKKALYESFREEMNDTSFPNLIHFFHSSRGESVEQKTSSAKQSIVLKFTSKQINESQLKMKMEQITKLHDFFANNSDDLSKLHNLYEGHKIKLDKHGINSDEWFYLRLTSDVVPSLKGNDEQELQDIVTPLPSHSINEKRESSILKPKDESCQIM